MSTTAIVPTVDYTGRDFNSLRDALIARIQARIPEWRGTDPSDFGIALVEAFAYTGDVLNYYIDRVANESSLLTATQRNSVINLAKAAGYTPTSYQAAHTTVQFTRTDAADPISAAIFVADTNSAGTQALTGAVSDGTNITYTTASTHSFLPGDVVAITGMGSGYNFAEIVVINVTGTTFAVHPASTTAGSVTASGSAVRQFVQLTTANAFTVGQLIHIGGVTPSSYNQDNVEVLIATSSTVTVNIPTADAYVSGGVTASYLTVPAGAEMTGSYIFNGQNTKVTFTTSYDVTTYAGGVFTADASHGISTALTNPNPDGDPFGETLGSSDGTPNQVFKLRIPGVVSGSVTLYVQHGSGWSTWTEVPHLADFGPSDSVYSTSVDGNDYVYVTFGDGAAGAIPTIFSTIKAAYVVGGGDVGNIPIGTLTTISALLDGSSTAVYNQMLSTTNITDAFGGTDPEDINSIRTAAAQIKVTSDRAVTLDDFAALALNVTGVSKASANAEVWNSVTVYVTPAQASPADIYPGYAAPSTTSIIPTIPTLLASVNTYLASRVQIGVTAAAHLATYIPVKIALTYSTFPTFSSSQVGTSIRTAIGDFYSFTNTFFGQVIHPEEVEAVVRSVAGVANVKVTALYKSTDTVGRNVLIAQAGQLFAIVAGSTATTTVTPASTDATLSSLTGLISTGGSGALTFSPSFLSTQGSYTVSLVGSGATAITLTPTAAAGSLSTITVSSSRGFTQTVASGATTSNITVAAGTTTVTVAVTAEDATTTDVYTITLVE